MHEAGIATAIAATLREHPQDWRRARILVRGGHTPPTDFDAALRFHLAASDPSLDLRRFKIVHLPTYRACANCGDTFEALELTDPCPTCGGASWPDYSEEEIELELVA
jgi:Zn finger protein HypA/HybF involved in hydrogenase expression